MSQSPDSSRPQHNWAGGLLALLVIISYSAIYLTAHPSTNQDPDPLRSEFLITLIFFLVMTLIILITGRRFRTQENFHHRAQQEYFELVQQAADPVIVLNEIGTILSANPAVSHISGYKPEDLINRHFLQINILVGMSVAKASKEFVQVLKGDLRPPYELTMMRKNGQLFHVEANARRVLDHTGRYAVHVILRDITDRKAAEEKLRQEKDRAHHYFNITGILLMTLDPLGKIAMINKKGCEILQAPQETLIGDDWIAAHVSPGSAEAVRKHFEKILTSTAGTYIPYKADIKTKSGETRTIAFNSTAIKDENKKTAGILISGEDITEKQKIEEQLRLQSAALEAAANAIVITDREGKIVWANHAFTEITGYSLKEVLGQNPKILRSGLHNEHFYQNLWTTICDGKIWHGEIVNRRKDDRLYTEEMTVTPVRNDAGQITHFIAIKRDVTERIRLQQNLEQVNLALEANTRKLERTLLEVEAKNKQLREAQNQLIQSEKLAAIGVLSSGIAHEIKNPLAIISLSVEEFDAHSEGLDAQSKNYIQMIKRAAERANNVIIELLRFARQSDLKIEPVDLPPLIDATILLVKNNAKFKGVAVQLIPGARPVIVPGDRILLEQVFFNLIMNAIDSTERGGEVNVNIRLRDKGIGPSKGQEAVVEVTDTGCGIPPEHLPKIFEPFFTTKEQGQGTGLGLSTVYTLIKRHQGSIDVQSEVGQGTTFIVTLPLEPTEMKEAPDG